MLPADNYTSGWHFRDELERQHFARQALLYLGRLNDRVADLADRASAAEVLPHALLDLYEEAHRSYRMRYWAFESIADLVRQGSFALSDGLVMARAAVKVALALFRRIDEPSRNLLREARREFTQLLQQCDHQIIIAHDSEAPNISVRDEYSWLRRCYEAQRGPMLGARWDVIEASAGGFATTSTTSEPASRGAANSPIRLTRSQSECFDVLRSYWLAQQAAVTAGGYCLRPPLIAAQSGCGKTRLVQWFSELMRVPLLILDTGSWLLSGSRADKPTLDVLREFHLVNERGIVFCDELDKAIGRDGGWWAGVNLELMTYLDRRTNWPAELLTKMRTNFLTVGAGTWQSVFSANKENLGFCQRAVDVDVIGAIEARFGGESIPQELAFRFDPPLLLHLPDPDEFGERIVTIRQEAGFAAVDPPTLATLVKEATSSGRGQRWLECYASRLLRERCVTEEREGWLHW